MAVTGLQALLLLHQTRCEACEASSPGYLFLLRVERRLSLQLSQLIRSNAELHEEIRTAFESASEWDQRSAALQLASLILAPQSAKDGCPHCGLLEDEVRRARLEYERLLDQQESYSGGDPTALRHLESRIQQAAAKRWSALSKLDAHKAGHGP